MTSLYSAPTRMTSLHSAPDPVIRIWYKLVDGMIETHANNDRAGGTVRW
jgi:hypothetical protein